MIVAMTPHRTELLCFGTRPGQGNAALVLRGDRSSVDERQVLARSSGVGACVFLDTDDGVTLDFYYPHARSPLCLHATLAAARVLLETAPGPLSVRTALGGQRLVLQRQDDDVYVELVPLPTAPLPLPDDLPAHLVPGIALVAPPAVASVGSPKLLLQVADPARLQALQPDLATIQAWGKAHGINGVYAWCERPDGALEGRNFNHPPGGKEDSATGVAAGALTVLLGKSLRIFQGASLGQPCLIRTVWHGDRLLVGGAAEYVQEAASRLSAQRR